jgi:hypothetical protein
MIIQHSVLNIDLMVDIGYYFAATPFTAWIRCSLKQVDKYKESLQALLNIRPVFCQNLQKVYMLRKFSLFWTID